MKFKTLLLISTIVLLSTAQNSNERSLNPIQSSMDNHAKVLLQDSSINAISMGIYKSGASVIGHYGEIDKGKGNRPTNATIYEIASVSKTFAGTLVAQAELEGKLSIEDDISLYLTEDFPNLKYQGIPIKIKHLITHTSGLPAFLPLEINDILKNPTDSLPFKIWEIEQNYNRNKFMSDLHSVVIDAIPGTKDGYSSADTELVAHILENVYNTPYEQLIQDKICDMLGMHSTSIALEEPDLGKLANGYIQNNTLAPHMTNTLWGAGGGIKSTMPDLINYIKFQLDTENDVAMKSHEVVYERDNHKIGYYWPVNFDEKLGTYYSHHGGAFGSQNYLFVFPEKGLGISIITNQNVSGTGNKLLKVVEGLLKDLG